MVCNRLGERRGGAVTRREVLMALLNGTNRDYGTMKGQTLRDDAQGDSIAKIPQKSACDPYFRGKSQCWCAS